MGWYEPGVNPSAHRKSSAERRGRVFVRDLHSTPRTREAATAAQKPIMFYLSSFTISDNHEE
jgi:hypothetical protein